MSDNSVESRIQRLLFEIRDSSQYMAAKNHDVFICHASEDKPNIVRPLVEALHESAISCWVDELEINWGDSVSGKINQGLEKSKYVVVIISESFLEKDWPQTELKSAFSQEMADGSTRVLPLFVGSRTELVKQLPLLADKRSLDWIGNPAPIAAELKKLLGRAPSNAPQVSSALEIAPKIPMVPKPITDLDRKQFLESSFETIQNYYQAGTDQIKQSGEHMHAELDKQTSSSFSCQIYVNGNRKSFCQIWIGSDFGKFSHIYYSTSPQAIGGSSKSYNEMISIDESSGKLRLKESIGDIFGKRCNGVTAEKVAAKLWERFVG